MLRLRTKLLTAYAAALFPLALGFGFWSITVAQSALETELGNGLATAAQVIASDYSASSTAGRISRLAPDSEATRERLIADLEVLRVGADLRRIRVVDAQLRTLLDTDPSAPFSTAFELEGDRREIDDALTSRERTSAVLYYGADGTPYKRGYAAVVLDDVPFAVVVVEGNAGYFSLLNRFRTQAIAFGAMLLVLMFAVTALMSRRITRPLSALSDAAKHIGEGDFDIPLPPPTNDEIGALNRALTQMKRSLVAREEEQQLMLAGIAHEVRNPLGGMELFLGVLEETVAPDSDEATYAGKVRRELNYLSRVVESFLSFSRDRPLQWERVAARHFLADVVESADAIDARALEVSLGVTPSDLVVTADVSGLRGVLLNLLQNAAQASSAGAEIHISARQYDHKNVEITIRDQAGGIPEDILKNVFRPFYTTREKGTGLGLPLAKRIIERHGGTLALQSVLGEGTTATVQLPLRDGVPDAAGTPTDDDCTITRDHSDWDGDMIG